MKGLEETVTLFVRCNFDWERCERARLGSASRYALDREKRIAYA